MLADFGLTRLSGEFRTQSGAITGTPMYMSPEQISTPDVEAPTLDVYSYGALIYRALTGRPPFVASDLKSLADMHLSATPESPGEIRPGVPKAVCDVVLGTLAKNPKDRPAIREVLAALTRVAPEGWDELLPDARPPAPPDRGAAAASAGEGTEIGDVTAGGGTEVEGESDDGGDTAVVLPRRLIAGDGPTLELEQPVYVPKCTRRWVKRTLVVAVSVLVGLAIGIAVLLLI